MEELLPCSALSASLGEELAGTAPEEPLVLVVEQPGPWGRDALAESRLPREAARGLAALEGVRVQVVRRHTRRYDHEGCTAWLAGVTAGNSFLEHLTFDDPRDLLDLDLGAGGPTGAGVLEDEPLFLVCTHSTRDSCCARLGLPLAREVMAAAGRRTWHTSHLGGHRFAATMACLPGGIWLGRVPPGHAEEVVGMIRERRIPLDYLRGRAGVPVAAQVAEAHVRREEGLDGFDDVRLESADGDAIVLAGEAGRRWELTVTRSPTGRARPLSCGTEAKVEDPGQWEVAVTAPSPPG